MRVIYIIALNAYIWMIRYLMLFCLFELHYFSDIVNHTTATDKIGGRVYNYVHIICTVYVMVGLTWQS